MNNCDMGLHEWNEWILIESTLGRTGHPCKHCDKMVLNDGSIKSIHGIGKGEALYTAFLVIAFWLGIAYLVIKLAA